MAETHLSLPPSVRGGELVPVLDEWLYPIVDTTVLGIGEARLADIRLSGKQTVEHPLRVHRTYTIPLDGYRHSMEITDPIDSQSAYTLFSYPGFTEHGKGGIRQKMHAHLAYTFPEATIISIDSNGIGTTGDRFDFSGRHDHGLEAMGQQRLDLARALCGHKPVFMQGTSMGTVISHRAAKANLVRPASERVNLRGLMWLSPALVDPSRVVKDMVISFPIGLGLDISKEVAYKTSPAALIGLGRLARRHDFRPADLPAMAHQLLELLKGTPQADVEAVISQIPTVVVSGSRDSLTQTKMFRELQQQHPNTLTLELIKGRGHGLAMKPGPACRKLRAAARQLVDETLTQPPTLSAVV